MRTVSGSDILRDLFLCESISVAESAGDEGLEVQKKAKIRGRLPQDDTYVVTSIEKIPPGDNLKNCDNCGKSIRHVCYLNGNDYVVGPDCALTIVDGPKEKSKVDKYVKDQKNTLAFVRKKMSDLGKNYSDQSALSGPGPAAFQKFAGGQFNLRLLIGSGARTFFKKDKKGAHEAVRNWVLDQMYARAMKDKPDAFRAALAKAKDNSQSRKNNFWYADYSDLPQFYYDNEDGIFKGYGIRNIGTGMVLNYDGFI